MKSTGQKLILVSFILALVASAVVFIYLQSIKSPKEVVKKAKIIVASETIPPRTLIDKKMIKEIEVTDNSIFSDYIKDSSQIVGKYTKESILKDEGFRKDKLINDEGSELSLKLDENHRAISITVTGESGVSNLLKPGDFVDIIVYLPEKKDGAKVTRPDLAKIILQNIEVLAVDKQLERDSSLNEKTNDKEKTLTSFLVTLSVTTQDTEKLVLAESTGSIKLALRPVKDGSSSTPKGITAQELTINTDNTDVNTNSTSTQDSKYTNYTVKKGDTLKRISQAFYGDPGKYGVIKEANNIVDENLIVTGEVIKIPVLN